MKPQREMPLMGTVKKGFREVPMQLVMACQSRRDALRLCVALSGLKHAYIAESIGMKPAQFSKILSGQAHLSEDLRDALQDTCGNEALEIYGAWRRGYQLVRDDRQDLADQLRAQLSALEAVGY